MSTELKVKKEKKGKKVKLEDGEEQVVKKEKKDKKRKSRDDAEMEGQAKSEVEVEPVVKVLEPAEEGETKEERRARKKAKKEARLVVKRFLCRGILTFTGKSRCCRYQF